MDFHCHWNCLFIAGTLPSSVTMILKWQRCNVIVIKRSGWVDCFTKTDVWLKKMCWYNVRLYSTLLNIPLQAATSQFSVLTSNHSSPYVKRTMIIKEECIMKRQIWPFISCMSFNSRRSCKEVKKNKCRVPTALLTWWSQAALQLLNLKCSSIQQVHTCSL